MTFILNVLKAIYMEAFFNDTMIVIVFLEFHEYQIKNYSFSGLFF